ncbi:sensor histidine kinase [Streptomyces sp. bgisy100]|uniref:sensor histidine kinase n=1 Tax=Streptomyces sp. bgisy100 TaxID=3413783 RepID=UPI003D74B4B8
MMRPLFGGAVYRSWLHACLGAALSLPPLTAVLAAFGRPTPAGVAAGCLATAAVIVAMGAPAAARRGSVRLANGLLGTGLPAPAAAPRSRWADRLRTSAWLVPHMALGAMVTAVTGLLVFAAVAFVTVWLDGGGVIDIHRTEVRVPAGPQGVWTLGAAAGCLVAACGVTAGGAAVLRLLAPALLDLRPAERLAAAEERMRQEAQRNRLAQELHDSIGHTLTAATIQAAVARELLGSDPQAALSALSSIEETSRAALDDLDHVLGVLRAEPSPTAPRRTLTDLGALTGTVRRAGAELTVETTGDLDRLPATVSREAYRIIQEGLTNALRHGGQTGLTLRVAVRGGLLEVELTNPVATAAGRPSGRHGHGLTGITERVRLLRGEVTAGPVDDPDPSGGGRWRLVARLPLRPAP